MYVGPIPERSAACLILCNFFGVDKGEQYTSAAYFANDEQKRTYEKVKNELIKSGKLKPNIATLLLEEKPFYPAEDNHQSYYKKNPIRYKYYSTSCGRAKRLKEVWGN